MPLREFLQMFGENIESSQPIAPSPTGIASGPERELVELVYENGQFMMQGQAQGPSNRAKKSPQMNDFPWQSHRVHDRPSGHDYLIEDEIEPWLNYAEDDDGFRQDFCGGISGEISGVTGNDPQNHNSFLSLGNDSFNQMLQHSNLVPVHSDANLEVRNATKACRNGFAKSSLPVQGQASVPPVGCGPPNIDANTTSNRPNVSFEIAVEGQASADDFSNMKTQKQSPAMPGNGTSVLNFSYFSRPATNYKAGLEKVDSPTASCSFSVEKMGSDKLSAANDSTPLKSSHMILCSNKSKGIYPHAQPKLISANVKSKEPVAKQSEESCHAEQSYVHRQDDVIKSLGHGTRQVTDHEKHVEPVAASSVGSGNSGERASNDQIPNLKRKSRDVDEAESPSEDNEEEESVGVKKRSHARGCSSSKRSRAAEVHNLSERRRRDRINEKMRALQELIPNCNKADKASMLDEAIEYLKTLQLQVQMMSMGAGLCMPQMMYPHGLQHMHPAHMPHFSAMAGGMGMGMGYGMGMLDMITGSPRYPMYPVHPMQGGHFRPPPGPNHQVYGHPGQGIPFQVPRPPPPSVPQMGQAPRSLAVGLNDSSMRAPAEASNASPALDSRFGPLNDSSHLARNTVTGTSVNQTTNQLQTTNKDFEQPVLASSDDQAPNLTATSDVSRKGGD